MPVDPFAGATRMLRALRERSVSAVELLDLHLRRIERFNPALNAIVVPNFDEARGAAQAADEARAHGQDGPLLGLPLTLKDCLYVRGLPTTGGVPERAHSIAEADSRVVARLRAAGAVIMGKTNVPPYAGDWQSTNPLFGRTNNPWDLDRTPGGSSGGSAAALAAGLTPLEFGGDLAGSIRIPAAFCGLYGHKSSETALPRSGHFPGPNTPNPVIAMAVQGPLARTSEDLELALDVAAGPDLGEEVAWRVAIPPARHERLSDFRVALLPSIPWVPVDAEITKALERLAAHLVGAGAAVGATQPHGFGDLRSFHGLYQSILAAITAAGRPEEERRAEALALRAADPESPWARGLDGSASDYILWFSRRAQYRAAFRAFFQEWDLLLAPITLGPAFLHTDAPWSERKLIVNGQPVDYGLQSVYPSLANLTGQPATAFPVGFTRSGLPIGLQAIGPYLEDHTPIRFAALLAPEIGGFQPPPGYDSMEA
jgi:amidase